MGQQESNAYKRNWYGQFRLRALTKLGGRCSNLECRWVNEDGSRGCTDVRALQADHIHGGGTKDRVERKSASSIWREILDGSDKYQLLCANCNWIKRNVQNECKGPDKTPSPVNAWNCEHVDRPNKAHGLCKPCYSWKWVRGEFSKSKGASNG